MQKMKEESKDNIEKIIIKTGIKIFPNGGEYEGELKDGMRHGYGSMKYPEGNKMKKYEGQWENDK